MSEVTKISDKKHMQNKRHRKVSYALCDNVKIVELYKTKIAAIHQTGFDGNLLYLLKIPHTDYCIYEFPVENRDVDAILSFVSTRNRRRNAISEETAVHLHNCLIEYTMDKFIREAILLQR